LFPDRLFLRSRQPGPMARSRLPTAPLSGRLGPTAPVSTFHGWQRMCLCKNHRVFCPPSARQGACHPPCHGDQPELQTRTVFSNHESRHLLFTYLLQSGNNTAGKAIANKCPAQRHNPAPSIHFVIQVTPPRHGSDAPHPSGTSQQKRTL